METFENIYGIICLISVIFVVYLMIVSRKKTMTEMKQGLREASSERVVSNDEAVNIARDFFESYNDKAYRKYAQYVVSDAKLPLTIEPQTIKMFFWGIFSIILFGYSLFNGMGSEGIIFNAIPIPGPLFQLLLVAIILLFVWLVARAWLNRNSKLTLERDSMTLHLPEGLVKLDYGSYQLLATPVHKQFTLEFISNNQQVSKFPRILSIFPNKTIVPILVVKAIEFGNLYSATGGGD